MNVSEILKLPLGEFNEKALFEDAVHSDSTISGLLDKIIVTEDLSDFFVAYVNDDDKLEAHITNKELKKFLDTAEGIKIDSKITEIDLSAISPNPINIQTTTTKDVFDMFKGDPGLSALALVDSSEAFVGKITRKQFSRKLKKLSATI